MGIAGILGKTGNLRNLRKVAMPNGTAHRPGGRLMLHHLPEPFGVRDFLYRNREFSVPQTIVGGRGKNVKERMCVWAHERS